MRQTTLSKLFGFTPKSLYNWKNEEKQYEKYANIDNDPRGAWQPIPITTPSDGRNNMKYPILSPLGEEILLLNNENWKYSKEKIQELINDNKIWFGGKEKNIPYEKRYLLDAREKSKKKGRPVVDLIEKYLDEEDIYEFLKDKKISWLDNIKDNESSIEKLLINIEKKLESYPTEDCLNALLLLSSLKTRYKIFESAIEPDWKEYSNFELEDEIEDKYEICKNFELKDPEIMNLDDYIRHRIFMDNTTERLKGANLHSSHIYYIQSIIVELYDSATLLFVLDKADSLIKKFKSLHKRKSVYYKDERVIIEENIFMTQHPLSPLEEKITKQKNMPMTPTSLDLTGFNEKN